MATIDRDGNDGTRGPGRTRQLGGALVLILALAGAVLLANGATMPVGRGGARSDGAGHRAEFLHGTLQADGTGAWRIGQTVLIFTVDSRIVVDGKAASADQLRDGEEASVMGRPSAAGFVVRQCTAAETVPSRPHLEGDGMEWSTEDPSVGWGRSPS